MDKKKSIFNFIKKIGIFIILGLIYLGIYVMTGYGIPCMFYVITGYKCPGCGMTHAMAAIAHGEIARAMEFNPLCLTALPIVCIYLLYRNFFRDNKRGKDFDIWEYPFLILLFITVIGYGIIRNFL